MKEPLKIAFVSQVYDGVLPPEQNSVGIWTYNTALELSRGNDVLVVSRRGPRTPARTVHRGIQFEFVRCIPGRVWSFLDRSRKMLHPGASPFFAQPIFVRDYVSQCIRRLRAFAPDVIHLHNFFNHLPAFRRAFPDAALVLHMHCDWLRELDRAQVERCLQAADLVVGCSNYVIQGVRARFPDLPVPFEDLPNGVDVTTNHPLRSAIGDAVLFVGRISPEKGVHVLLDAWRQVKPSRPNAQLTIVGPMETCPRELLVDLSADPDVRALSRFYDESGNGTGSYENHLRQQIPDSIASSVTFTGSLPHEQVLEMYSRSDLLVNPSLSEAFGMSLVEALNAGTPVVASHVGGMEEIVRETGGGILVTKADAAALSDAIIRMLKDPPLRNRMGKRGKDHIAELYSWERIGALAETLYREVIAKKA